MGERHDPAYMEILPGRFPRKQGRGQRRWNVWYWAYRCPVCGDNTSRPCNPFRGRKVPPPVCDGITYDGLTGRPVKRPAKMPEEKKE